MSTPYTLAEAFELLRQHQQKSTNDAIDILGIVSNISYSAPSLPSGRSGFRKCQIWLLDESLDTSIRSESNNGALAGSRFVLYESSEIARTVKEKIKAGDILRFNRVTLKSFRGSLQFQFSSLDPEPGLSWFRLGSVDDYRIHFEKVSNDALGALMPKGMITSKERVTELADWYKNERKSMNPPSAPSALQTRKRQLDELQSSIGLLSHITVCVTCIRLQPANETKTNYLSTKRGNNRRRPPVAFASFVDDSGTSMSFIDSSGRFISELKSAQSNSHTTRLVMTNVSTDHKSNLRGSTTADDIVLVPTEMTTGRLISKDKTPFCLDASRSSVYDFDSTNTQGKAHGTDIIVRSGISDICVDGLSLKNSPSVFSSPSEYLKTITGNHRNFGNAIISLEKNDEQVGSDGIPATPGVLKSLCGGLDIAEISNDETLCMYSKSLLQDLLHERTMLEWTIRKDERNDLEIVKATLHCLFD